MGKKNLDLYKFIKSNPEYLKDFITRSTYHSNAIEGNTLTYAETYAVIYNDNSFVIKKEPREIYEAMNHRDALKYLFENMLDDSSNNGLMSHDIIALNEIINRNINETNGFRKINVFIRGSEYIPPDAKEVPTRMSYFVYNYNRDTEDIFNKIARSHIEFERIHPFEDGNGRTGRLLINYELLKNNLPPAIITKEDRVKYYEFLKNGDIEGFAKFLEETVNKEKERLEKFGYISEDVENTKENER